MHAFHASALNDDRRILVCGVNWIGDSVMSMPALQTFHKANPEARMTMLVKPGLMSLWKLHKAFDEILPLHEGIAGTWKTVTALRRRRFGQAFVLPHSFRSAIIPWLAGIPLRTGMPGHGRDFLLTKVIRPSERPGRSHQAYEYLELLLPAAEAELQPPLLELPETVLAPARKQMASAAKPLVALIPGAARGPSKQWPREHFIELGRMLSGEKHCGIVVLGARNEMSLCDAVAHGIGSSAINLAGQTDLVEWVAILKTCDLVVANDSGGVHVAAAVGTPVVALYGITDPLKTGPRGKRCRILQNSVIRSRDIPRNSWDGRASLATLLPEQVYHAAMECLHESGKE